MLLNIKTFNDLRRAMVSPESRAKETRKEMARSATNLKVIAFGMGVISASVAYGLSSVPLFGKVITIGGITAAAGSYDLYRIAENIETMCNSNFKDRAFAIVSADEFMNKVLANTILVKPLFGTTLSRNLAKFKASDD